MKENLEFLADLQQKLLTQSNDGNASPVFWVIRDYEWVFAPEGYCDRTIIADNEGNTYTEDEIGDLIETVLPEMVIYTDFDYKDRDELAEVLQTDDIGEVFEFIDRNLTDHDYTLHNEIKKEVIKENSFFVTKEEAQKHIELNYYHYSNEVHTYAMTAWRSPQVEELWKVLRETDFKSLIVEEKESAE